jgi:hypothetical protein
MMVMYRKAAFVVLISALAAGGAVASQFMADTPAGAAASAPAVSVEALAAELVAAVKDAVAANPDASQADLQTLVEDAIMAVFVKNAATPDVAKAAMEQAMATLSAEGFSTTIMAAIQAAVTLALAAIEAATGAVASGPSAYSPPPLSGGGGGGGGVTHPPVN